MFKLLPIICLLPFSAYAVINTAQRREAPIQDSYGPPPPPPPSSGYGAPAPVYGPPILPAPVYGAPGPVAKYPPPPPDIPPPIPHKEYGVPVQKYGPPSIEYGAPLRPPQHQHHHPQGPPPPPRRQPSFLDQIREFIGGLSGSDAIPNAGQNNRPFGPPPSGQYGPPPSAQYGPPKQHYGPPKQHGGPPPPQNYGPPPQQNYGPPPQQNYGPPPQQNYGPPKQNFGPPRGNFGPPKQNYGPPLPNFGPPKQFYGPPRQNGIFAPPHFSDIKCDGWKPIAGPAIQNVESPSSSYGPPPSGSAIHDDHHHGHNSDVGLQLPHLDVTQNFLGDIGGFDVVKSHGIELTDSYSAPPADSYAPGQYRPSFQRPAAPLIPPSGIYGVPPGGSYNGGLAIQHGSVSGNLKPWPVNGSPPRHPLPYREPVPQGLIESIGHAVEQLDAGGYKHENQYHGGVYLPPPSNEVPVPAVNLNILPLDNPPKQFLTQHSTILLPSAQPLIQEPRGHIGGGNDCGHGPQLGGGGGGFQQSISVGNFEQSNHIDHSNGYNSNAQSYIEQSQSFEQSAGGNFESPDSSYGPPASGIPLTGFDSELRSSASSKVELEHHESQTSNVQALPGLNDLSGLNILSAQKSQSVDIPVKGNHGTYQLQFQSASPGGGSDGGHPPHEQILSDGLLQSILSAIEQPNANAVQQVSTDTHNDHKDVAVFLKSPEGQAVLAEPSTEKTR